MNPFTVFDAIIPAEALQISVQSYANQTLCVQAPLVENRNDKKTAFAGSIASVLMLAGWGMLTLRLHACGLSGQVMIAESQIRYLRPVRSDFEAMAKLEDSAWKEFLLRLKQRSSGSVSLCIPLFCNGEQCAEMEAHYAVIASAAACEKAPAQ